jgi:hypothetical protein
LCVLSTASVRLAGWLAGWLPACCVGVVYAQGREIDRAQQSWEGAIAMAESNGDSGSAEKLRANLQLLDKSRS